MQAIEFLGLVVLGNLLLVFLRGYLREKGENLATKEDIAVITSEIERVRQQYTEQLETVRAALSIKNQLRMAAAEKRLEKHQEITSESINFNSGAGWECQQHPEGPRRSSGEART